LKPAKKIFLDVGVPAPGAAPEQVVVKLTRPDVVFGRPPAPDYRALHNAHRLLAAPTCGYRHAGTAVLRRQDGLSLPRPRVTYSLFFFAHV
jgi:hypothetical protein